MMSPNHPLNTSDEKLADSVSEKVFVVVEPKACALFLTRKPAASAKIHSLLFPKSYFVIALVVIALMSGVVGCLLTVESINDYMNLEAAHRQTIKVLESPNDSQDRTNASGTGTKPPASGQSTNDNTDNKDEVALPPLGSPVDPEDNNEPLRQAFKSWLDATNKCDINKQMSFYKYRLDAFYLARGLSQKAIRAEKVRVFGGARIININADEPAIVISPDRSEAIMRFRKSYTIVGNIIRRNGEVIQELRWQRVNNSWLIVSERDLLVMR